MEEVSLSDIKYRIPQESFRKISIDDYACYKGHVSVYCLKYSANASIIRVGIRNGVSRNLIIQHWKLF